jgi:Spy/CpxP family protein refolding chaperone
MKKLIAMLAVAAALCVSADSLLAQDNGGGNGGGNGGQRRNRGGGGFGQMDPAQRQQFMMDRYKEQLGFTNDTDWSAVEPLVQKVAEARRDVMAGMFAGFRRGGPGGGGDRGPGGGPFGGQPDPDREALQQAIDNNAPAAQIKTLLDKYRASQKTKEAKLESAQSDLRKVLTQKQEASAVLAGLLN